LFDRIEEDLCENFEVHHCHPLHYSGIAKYCPKIMLSKFAKKLVQVRIVQGGVLKLAPVSND